LLKKIILAGAIAITSLGAQASIVSALGLASAPSSISSSGWQEVSGPTLGGGFTGNYLRTNGTGILNLTFSGLQAHTGIDLGLFVAQLNSLDPVRDGDIFDIEIDGQEVLRVGLGFGTELGFSDPVVSNYFVNGVGADEQLVHDVRTLTIPGPSTVGSFTSRVYNFGNLDALQNITHSASTLSLKITGVGGQGWSNEAYAIDNLSVSLVGVPEPSSLAFFLPAALALLGFRRRTMSA